MPIGVFDSGFGGLTVLRRLTRAMPNQPFLYFGDSAHAPYGEQSPDRVADLTQAAVARLFDEGCQLVLIACNTASALGLRRLQQSWLPSAAPERRVLGVFVPIVEALTGRVWGDPPEPAAKAPAPAGRRTILFFATQATVASGAFEREVAARAAGVAVISEACPGLVDALEAGLDPEAAAARACANARARLDGRVVDAVVLGCTHYPLAEAAFAAHLPAGAPILSQPDIVTASLARYLERRPQFESVAQEAAPLLRPRCLTTGDPAAIGPLAERFYGAPLAFEAA